MDTGVGISACFFKSAPLSLELMVHHKFTLGNLQNPKVLSTKKSRKSTIFFSR